jgi:hypothetical protein
MELEMDQKDLKKIEQRTTSYWFEDGVFDIVVGFGLALLGLSYFAVEALQPVSWLASVAGLLQVILMMAVFFLLNRVVVKIKERIVYPRTGEIKYHARPRSERLKRGLRSGVLSFLFAAAFSIFALAPKMHQILPAIVGGLFAFSFFLLGLKVAVMRYYFIGVIVFVAGLMVSLLPTGFINQTGLLFLAIGLIMALAGGVGLWIYIKNNPIDPGNEEIL